MAESVTQELRHFNAMQIDAFHVLRARANELEGQRAAIEARRSVSLARLDLEELLAGGSTPLAASSRDVYERSRNSTRGAAASGHARNEENP